MVKTWLNMLKHEANLKIRSQLATQTLPGPFHNDRSFRLRGPVSDGPSKKESDLQRLDF